MAAKKTVVRAATRRLGSSMIKFEQSEFRIVLDAVNHLTAWLGSTVLRYLDLEQLGGRTPPEWSSLHAELVGMRDQVMKAWNDNAAFVTFADDKGDLLKRAFIHFRRSEADRIRTLQDKTHHLGILGALDEDFEAIERLMNQPWFLSTDPRPVPRVSDFLPAQRFEAVNPCQRSRQTDPVTLNWN